MFPARYSLVDLLEVFRTKNQEVGMWLLWVFRRGKLPGSNFAEAACPHSLSFGDGVAELALLPVSCILSIVSVVSPELLSQLGVAHLHVGQASLFKQVRWPILSILLQRGGHQCHTICTTTFVELKAHHETEHSQ